MPIPLSQWQSLAVAADEGHLFLESTAAARCHKACELFLGRLREHQYEAENLKNIDGWGTFTAGLQLRQIYADKAYGGENNMFDVLQSHIDTVTQMQAVFAKFFTVTDDNERQNARDIAQQGGN